MWLWMMLSGNQRTDGGQYHAYPERSRITLSDDYGCKCKSAGRLHKSTKNGWIHIRSIEVFVQRKLDCDPPSINPRMHA